jgi:site-specific DNA-methyltransferase (adenine-specific)
MTIEKVTIGPHVLYCGDCREVLPTLGKVDAVVTDPPFGIGSTSQSGLRKKRTAKTKYEGFDDTPEYIEGVVVPTVKAAISQCRNAAVTPGFKNLWMYPKPAHVGGFQYAGSTVMSCWGPCLWQPILYYGKDPYQGRLRPDSFLGCNDVDRTTDHPCPKPLASWTRLIDRASLDSDTVLDMFMGSGTGGVSCAKLNRKFIGIELDPGYFEIAVKRITEAVNQNALFTGEIKPVAEPVLFGDDK